MSEGMTQLEAYKHLLDVAQNILQSLDIEKDILTKYDTLKRGIKAKIRYTSHQRSQKEAQTISMYKNIIQNVTTCLHEFQVQIEDPNSNVFAKSIQKFKNAFKSELIKLSNPETDRRKQQVKVQISYFNYIFDQIAGRFGNLQLLLEVHSKMQQIVQQAARKEVSYREKQLEYQERLKKNTKQLQKIRNVEGYIKQVQSVRDNREQLKMLEKELKIWGAQFM